MYWLDVGRIGSYLLDMGSSGGMLTGNWQETWYSDRTDRKDGLRSGYGPKRWYTDWTLGIRDGYWLHMSRKRSILAGQG